MNALPCRGYFRPTHFMWKKLPKKDKFIFRPKINLLSMQFRGRLLHLPEEAKYTFCWSTHAFCFPSAPLPSTSCISHVFCSGGREKGAAGCVSRERSRRIINQNRWCFWNCFEIPFPLPLLLPCLAVKAAGARLASVAYADFKKYLPSGA